MAGTMQETGRGRLTRRRFLAGAVGGALAGCGVTGGVGAEAGGGRVMTVFGGMPAAELGWTLVHEHVLVDFIGADRIGPGRYDEEEAFRVILPHLETVRGLGCRTLIECTPAYIGRDVRLLRRLASASGLQLVTNTGYYGAADNKFLPAHARTESARELAARWLREWEEGIEGTSVRPGFLKLGVGGTELSALHEKLVVAGAAVHRRTGLTVAVHTGPSRLAHAQLDVLEREGVRGDAWVWVHAQAEPDPERILGVARRGAWVSMDGYHPRETTRYLDIVERFRAEGRLGQLLLSHDAGWYRPGEKGGGEFRPFDALFRVFIPRLREVGLSEGLIQTLFRANPARAFAIEKRLR